MTIELTPPTPEDVPRLAEIFFVAFKDILDRYGLPLDIPDLGVATAAMTGFVNGPDFYGVVARVDGRIVGSNFVSFTDPVAGVGPITVEPGVQAQGVGRALMRHVVDHALARHGPQVRLVQDAINMVSLSLYTSIGFDVREPLVLMTFPPAAAAHPSVRRVEPADVERCDEICRRVYKVSRKNELAGAVDHAGAGGPVPFLRERGGRVVGYAVPGFFGHGTAETNEDLLSILTTAARESPPFASRFLCPSRNGDLYRMALRRARAVRGLHLMSIGPYESPEGAWFPSIAY